MTREKGRLAIGREGEKMKERGRWEGRLNDLKKLRDGQKDGEVTRD